MSKAYIALDSTHICLNKDAVGKELKKNLLK